ncbi:MAG: hypothetical protein KDC12_08630 [Flavobacteriales bacterium]|nr:hypothetical protein [Flavobacteriales bacterium]
MKLKATAAILAALTLVAFHACKKDPVPPVIFVTPSSLFIEVTEGTPFEFDVSAQKGDANLRQIQIFQKPIDGVTSKLLDTLVSGSQADFFWIHAFTGEHPEVVLTFKVIDQDGYDSETARRVYVEGATALVESTGHMLYSKYSTTGSNAFNIENLESYFLANNPDTLSVDLIELDGSDDGELSNQLTSWSGIRFVRNNAFNYPEATVESAEATYLSSTALQVLSNIAIDDILVTEYDTVNHAYAVIKITGISTAAGSDEDRYEFNVKK